MVCYIVHSHLRVSIIATMIYISDEITLARYWQRKTGSVTAGAGMLCHMNRDPDRNLTGGLAVSAGNPKSKGYR